MLQSSAYIKPRTFQLLTPPCQRGGWGCTSSWEGIQPGKGYSIPYDVLLSNKCCDKGRERKGHLEWWRLPSQETITRDEPCFPGSSWTPACWWEAVNSFLGLQCFCVQLLLYLVNCLYLNPLFPLFNLPDSLPNPTWGEQVWSCVGLCCLPGLNLNTELKQASQDGSVIWKLWHFKDTFLVHMP